MAIKLINNAEFLHIPKTGGSWVTSVLESNNLVLSRSNHKHADYDSNLLGRKSITGRQHLLEAVKLLNKKFISKTIQKEKNILYPFRFCFVRHPLSWYESWWRYMEGLGWNDWG